jgi:hypothetical protein
MFAAFYAIFGSSENNSQAGCRDGGHVTKGSFLLVHVPVRRRFFLRMARLETARKASGDPV